VAHDHHHDHGVSPDADKRRVAIALALILAFMAGEVVAAIVADSLALLSDAAHMLTDAGALALSLVAMRLAARPAAGAMTFGLKRAEILSALVNGATLAILGAFIVFEAVQRLIAPPEVEGGIVLVVAVIGIFVNLLATWILARAERKSLNLEGSLHHLLTDMYAFIATAISGALILTLGFQEADPIASLIVAALMFRAAWILIRKSGRVLLEGAPAGIEPSEIGRAMLEAPGVIEVHDLHVWEVTSGFPALSAHVLVGADDDCHAARLAVERVLVDRFDIHHSTLQMDHRAPQRLLSIDL
jgi:cobalt-zinc-cadmium efflux system protein